MNAIMLLDYMGVFVFAMSGLLAASGKKLDLFGGFIIAFVTALGGGTLRDLLLNVEIGWIMNPNYIYIVISGAIFALIFKKALKHVRKTIFLFDSIGIAIFTISGVQKAILFDMPVPVVIIFGVITATFGGVIRDILCNEIPLIFRKELYATACITGGIVYICISNFGLNETLNTVLSGALIIIIRTISVVKKISLPVLNDKL